MPTLFAHALTLGDALSAEELKALSVPGLESPDIAFIILPVNLP